jgi:hypothetical protein
MDEGWIQLCGFIVDTPSTRGFVIDLFRSLSFQTLHVIVIQRSYQSSQ